MLALVGGQFHRVLGNRRTTDSRDVTDDIATSLIHKEISAMLVLSRKKNEAIHIGEEGIVITVVEIRGQQVRIGIEAPADVPIRRQEILHRDIPKHLLVSVETRRENRLNSMATRATS